MLDLELLRAFVAVADCGGFHRAAEQLHLTQSTISQQIKRLELETRRPLFRRTTRSVALTDEGEMLLGDARRLLQLEEAARQRLVAPRLSGSVRLGVVEEVAGGSLPSALGRFAALHRGVKLEVQIGVSAELIEQLNAGRLDLVFAKRPLGTSKGRLVWREPLVWTAAETFDLVPGAPLPLALYRERSVSRDAALSALRDGELGWEIVYTSPSLTGVRAAAVAGLAVTPAAAQRRHHRPAHSRNWRRPAAASRPGIRHLREKTAGQGLGGACRCLADAGARSPAPHDLSAPNRELRRAPVCLPTGSPALFPAVPTRFVLNAWA
ncbi:LysR family transcriptional regulator [Bradyrhizobium elkanii]|uniref:LysR family transcriptional regulator n=1 Tax=Bradyrhizobium elkanii TaxID=29448 RepID=UPI0022276A48|nr:LysR family transcriptional regulator [Bradyrhizobium elkanii]MCW2371406.1 DNA-binding transcriptional LysR family regulator [Bradyrhizobium elkanii]